MGQQHATAFSFMPDVELLFLSRNPERDRAFAEANSATPVASFDELLAQADFVDVCTPTDSHLDYALRAIANGTAVFMEKPVARTLEDGITMMKAADAANVPLMIGQVVRYFPEFVSGRKTVISGGIGTPAAARTRRGGPAPAGWFMDHTRSGGVLLDLAIHDFDWLRWTLGEVKSLYSRSVQAQTDQGPDYALTTLTFDSGAIAHVEATWMDPSGFRTTFEVAGSGGLIQHDSRETATLRTHTGAGSTLDQNLDPTDDPYYLQLEAFIKALGDGSEVPVSAYEGNMALSISLAAIQSAKTGQAVSPVRI